MSDEFIEALEMAECSFCESGTYDFVRHYYERTGVVIYCRKCWEELSRGLVK